MGYKELSVFRVLLVLSAAALMAGCALDGTPTAHNGTPTLTGTERDRSTSYPAPSQTSDIPGSAETPDLVFQYKGSALGYTYQQPDGNRLVSGSGTFPDVSVRDIQLDGIPAWVVAVPRNNATVWAVALTDGRIQAFEVDKEGVSPITLKPDNIGSAVPAIKVVDDQIEMLNASAEEVENTHPVSTGKDESLVYIGSDGSLGFVDPEGGVTGAIQVDALLDGRLLVDEKERILLLTGPTSRYNLGVLGDTLEASAISLVNGSPEPGLIKTITIDGREVIEGTAPIWADMDGDGVREIIVTQSSIDEGARIVIYDESGNLIASGPAIGQGFRWRHQIAAAPFGSDDEMELAAVLTPHIGGVVEFYQLKDDRLEVVATLSGFSSHVISTRNLDMALAGDFNGDGRPELVVPNQGRTEVSGIQRSAIGADVVWTMAVDGQVVSNLSAVDIPGAGMALGLGRDDGVLRIWQP